MPVCTTLSSWLITLTSQFKKPILGLLCSFFSTSFLVVDSDSSLSKSVISDNLVEAQDDDYTAIIVIIILAIIGSSIVVIKKRMK